MNRFLFLYFVFIDSVHRLCWTSCWTGWWRMLVIIMMIILINLLLIDIYTSW